MRFIRPVISSVLFAVAVIFSFPVSATNIILIIAAVICGYDMIPEAIKNIRAGEIISPALIVVLVAVAAFIISFSYEAAAVIILFRIGMILIDYTTEKTIVSAVELSGDAGNISEIIDNDKCELNIRSAFRKMSSFALEIIIGLAIIYSVLLPLVSHYSFKVAFHRALMVILLANPFTVMASIPSVANVALGFAAEKGYFFNNSSLLEKFKESKIIVFEKDNVFTGNIPQVLKVSAHATDSTTMMNLLFHLTFNQTESYAKAIRSCADFEYNNSLVTDTYGYGISGVEGKIGGQNVVFGTRQLLNRFGVEVPDNRTSMGDIYYLAVSGRIAGYIVLSHDETNIKDGLLHELKYVGVNKCELISGENAEITEEFSKIHNFDAQYSDMTAQNKYDFLYEMCNATRAKKMYVYANEFGYHSAADFDLKVGQGTTTADCVLANGNISDLAEVMYISRRMDKIITQNCIFVLIVKLLLIVLSMIGFCNLWFAMFMDISACLATILNAIRIDSQSSIDGFFNTQE